MIHIKARRLALIYWLGSLNRHSPDSRSLGAIVCLIEARRNEIRSQPTRGQPNGETLGLVTPEPAAFP
jgi:hypothetical protein